MRISTNSLFIKILLLLATSTGFSQIQVQEEGFQVLYQQRQLQLQFDALNATPKNILITDAQTDAVLSLETGSDSKSYLLTHLHPSQIVKVRYDTFENGETVSNTRFLATPSTSSGDISIFFNHNVDTSYSQGVDAVNLSNTLEDKLINYIDACQNTLDIAIYNSASPSASSGIAGAINAAHARGVQVRIVYDGSTGSNMIPLLNPAIPRLASPDSSSYGIMHNKFVIFDADNADANIPLVWTGSTNWTAAQIDGPDRNNAIVVQDQALAQIYKIEFEEMWGSTTQTPDALLSKFGPYKTNNTPHNLIIGGKAVEIYFSPTDGTNSKIIAAINSANSDINIATMLITRTDIRNAIINKYNSGVTNVNLVADNQNPASNQFSTLEAALPAGHVVKFTAAGIMHHKFMVVDNFNLSSDPLVTVGSHNWSTSAEIRNDENTLIVHDASVANQYYQAFAYLYQLAGGVILPLSVNTNAAPLGVVLYPNPSDGIYTLENKSGNLMENATVWVFDIVGKKVYDNTYANLNSTLIDLTNQTDGMYFVKITSGDTQMHFKIIKN